MIRFACSKCGQEYERPEGDAGQRGTCIKCGAVVQVPQPSIVPPPLPSEGGDVPTDSKPQQGEPAAPSLERLERLLERIDQRLADNEPKSPEGVGCFSGFALLVLIVCGIAASRVRLGPQGDPVDLLLGAVGLPIACYVFMQTVAHWVGTGRPAADRRRDRKRAAKKRN